MQQSRRKKIFIWVLLFILLLVAIGYAFRYPLIRSFQSSRLRSLTCVDADGSTKNCLERVWVHRVNTTERFDILKDEFKGFEADIVYDSSHHSFSVYHPPLPVDEHPPAFDSFLQYVNKPGYHWWFDTRGVDSFNMQGALDLLAGMTDTVHPGDKTFFIELYDMSAAKLFAENGFQTAFNVSESLLKRLLTGDSILQDSVNRVLKDVHYVSQDFSYVPFLKKFFPGKLIITWRPEFKTFIDTKEIQQLLDDQQVAVVLVSIKTRYYK